MSILKSSIFYAGGTFFCGYMHVCRWGQVSVGGSGCQVCVCGEGALMIKRQRLSMCVCVNASVASGWHCDAEIRGNYRNVMALMGRRSAPLS